MDAYLRAARTERLFSDWIEKPGAQVPALFVAEGFEERSIGLLRRFAAAGVRVPFVAVARYRATADLNVGYRTEFESLAQEVSNGRWGPYWNEGDGTWVGKALNDAGSNAILLDISGLSNTSMFSALDAFRGRAATILLGYSEAAAYRPTLLEWEQIVAETDADVDAESRLAERVDEAEWLYGGAHTVDLMADHEGYDSAGECALLAFLPFKPARLVAVLGEQQYCEYVFVAGKPRLAENAWRLDALKRMNERSARTGRVIEMETFGYRSALAGLRRVLCGDRGLLNRYDVHLAPFGSKVQNLACWIVSSLISSITVVTARPERIHEKAFSEGVGESWVFPFTVPGTPHHSN